MQLGQMEYQEKNGVGFLTFPQLAQFSWLRQAFSTRKGGVSTGEFSTMNLSFGRGDSRENVEENYRRFCTAVGFSPDSLTASAQDHHTVVRRVGQGDWGVGIWRPKDRESVDGLCTDEPGVTLVTYYADCVPLYFVDPEHRAIGLAHAGWRGTVAQMGREMLRRMEEEFGTRPCEVYAAIGPSIGPCCYEVDEPVAREFLALTHLHPEDFVEEKSGGKYQLNLWECNRQVLAAAGVPESHITVGGVCTQCHQELLFSHRATAGKRGGMAAFLEIREDAR
ncbi:MAG TPA: peptidoglycan editing factor PgeF [Firmicutes bacterium]|nr:peptidoglycan editing factor PgeF [Bacillota bacterium]